MSYREFGDVVTFDTTYKKNRYDLIFGVFTGINHHGSMINQYYLDVLQY